ncbi:50S ribosomal protein L13 [Caldisericum exile]|uniref:Large ribosomal subunit protein uL13 n=1 Tax=Caldisericum exile (strain DSM 21853 / NBRC 104410 / AZM16c01) TaxID=511051 RepID=A0A7U6GF35_CALEA|nr:50S ribosomal protein L13 [Caldisericum exile]BAL81234.1 50S ribosomal protein L13 [Caldisericum exile AZM16c01]
MMKITKFLKPYEVNKKWVLIDAEGESIGRVAVLAASILRGKHKATFTPNVNMGDNVIVINASKVKVTGRKLTDKIYYKHTGYVGNMQSYILRDILQRKPEFLITHAVKLMLPKNRLGRKMIKGLKVYSDANYPKEFKIERVITLSKEE